MSASDLPDFSDFLRALPPDYLKNWLSGSDKEPVVTTLPNSQEGASRFATDVVAISMKITLAMLRDYHEWLAQELASRSLRLL